MRNACEGKPCSACAHAQGPAGDTHGLRDGDDADADRDEQEQAAAYRGVGRVAAVRLESFALLKFLALFQNHQLERQ